MATQVGEIYWDLDLDDKKFQKGVKNVDDGTSRMSKSFEHAKKASQALALAVAAAGAAVIAFGVSSVKAFQESESMIAQTNAVLKSTGGIAGVTAKDVDVLSKSLERQTAFSDEQVRSVENMGLTFTAIHKDIFPKVTEAALDMATALNHGLTPSGEEASETMKLLGKALQDPDKGLGALHRVGVNTDELKKKFKGVNDIATKQKLILQELGTEFGGSAAAAANTYAGRLQQLKNRFNDLQEGIGHLILNALEPLIRIFDNWMEQVDKAGGLINYLSDFYEKHKDTIMLIVGALAGALIPAFVSLALAVGKSLIALSPFMAIGSAIAFVVQKLVEHFGGWRKAFDKIQEVMPDIIQLIKDMTPVLIGLGTAYATYIIATMVAGLPILIATAAEWWAINWPILAVAAAIGALTALIVTLWNKNEGFRNFVIEAWEKIRQAVSLAWSFIQPALEQLKEQWQQLVDKIRNFLREHPEVVEALKMLGKIVGSIVLYGLISAIGALTMVLIGLLKVVQGIVWWIEKMVDLFEKLERLSKTVGKFLGSVSSGKWNGGVDVQVGGQGGGISSRTPSFGGGLASGGSVYGSTPYLVGEQGPELFIPRQSGRIMNNDDTMSLRNSSNGNTYITVDMSNVMAVSRTQVREVGNVFVEAVNEGLQARGLPQIADGKVVGAA